MALVVPFKALRPSKLYAARVASPPYDVLTVEEARALTKDNPLSFLFVEKSEIDDASQEGGNEDCIYRTAKRNLDRLVREGILVQDENRCFYIYRQRLGVHEQYGIAAGISVDEYESGLIKRHELTRADKEEDRIRHVSAVDAQTGPVFVAYRARPSLDRLVEKIAAALPEYDFIADDGVFHTVWIVESRDDIARITEEFAGIDRLYIADGHHRAAAAAAVGRMRREDPSRGLHRESDYIMAVLFPHDQIRIMAYHRVVRDTGGLAREEIFRLIGEKFSLSDDFTDPPAAREHEFGMYLDGRWHRLTAKDGSFDGSDPVAALDVSILQDNLLGPVLGIADPRTDSRIEFVGGIKGKKRLEHLVDSGAFAVAFFLHPTSVEQMITVAEAGRFMPPKSTWFEPKLRSGIFVHLLGGECEA